MAEIGIDISGHHSKNIEEFSDTEIDLALSVCRSSAKTICAFVARTWEMGNSKSMFIHFFIKRKESAGSKLRLCWLLRQ